MGDKVRIISKRLIKRFQTRDPFVIAKELGIRIIYVEMKTQKGFCRNILRNFFIFINSNTSHETQKMSCAHELGHVVLQKDELIDSRFLLEMETYDPKNRLEYEANRFAANLLIDEEELLEFLSSGADLKQAAAALGVNENLLLLKLEEMKKDGADVRISDLPKRTFMGTIQDCSTDYTD